MLIKQKPLLIDNPDDKFCPKLFLPHGEYRKEEGGLRTKGYFKQSFPDKPLVTMITVVFNGEKYLEETIRSVIGQSYDNVEYVVIDGASTDGTLDILRRNENKIDYWISEKDRGIYHAMNKGVSVATGRIVGIINSDDWLEPDAVRKVANACPAKEEEYVIHGKIAFYDDQNRPVAVHGPKKIPGYHLFSTPFKHPAMFVSQTLYRQLGLYDEDCGLAADYDLMLRIVCNNKHSRFLDEILTNVRLVGVSTGVDERTPGKELVTILKRNTGSRFKAFLGLFVRTLNQWTRSFLSFIP